MWKLPAANLQYRTIPLSNDVQMLAVVEYSVVEYSLEWIRCFHVYRTVICRMSVCRRGLYWNAVAICCLVDLAECSLLYLGYECNVTHWHDCDIRSQVIELIYFGLLCVVFLFAFGVAAQSLLYPLSDDNWWDILYQIFYRQYLSVFQEFHLDELQGTQSWCTGLIWK